MPSESTPEAPIGCSPSAPTSSPPSSSTTRSGARPTRPTRGSAARDPRPGSPASVASQRPSSTTTFIPRAIAPQSSIVAGRTSIAPRIGCQPRRSSARLRARARAGPARRRRCDQASGVVERRDAGAGVDPLAGDGPAGVRGRAAKVADQQAASGAGACGRAPPKQRRGRGAAQVASRSRAAGVPSAARLQALQAVGAVQGLALASLGDDAEAAVRRPARPQQGAADRREERRGAGTAAPPRPPPSRARTPARPPPAPAPAASRIRRTRRGDSRPSGHGRRAAASDRVGEVVAGRISPGSRRGLASRGARRVPGARPRGRRRRPSRRRRPGRRGPRPARRRRRSGPPRRGRGRAGSARRAGPRRGSRRRRRRSRRRRVARPDVGPAVPGAGGDRAAAPVGQRPQDEQRALVHPPRPGRRAGAERSAPAQPAPCRRRSRRRRSGAPARHRGRTRRPPPSRLRSERDRGRPDSARRSRARRRAPRTRSRPAPPPNARHRAQHVGPRQVALADRRRPATAAAAGRRRRRPAARSRCPRAPSPRPAAPAGCRSAPARPGRAAGRRRRRRRRSAAVSPPSPTTAAARNGGGSPGSAGGVRGSAGDPPETRTTPRPRRATSARAAGVRATPQCNQPLDPPVASLPVCAAARRAPRRGSSVGRAHD